MRLPNRKPGKYTFPQFDPVMTEDKLQQLQHKLHRIKTVSLPQAIKDTQKYAANGDFSENAEYQIAKGRLRGLNRAVEELQQQINKAQVINSPTDTTHVQIGHTVTVSFNGTEHTFTILGPTETNPSAGIISYKSPIGAALLDHAAGDTVEIQLGKNTVQYTILSIQ